MHKSILLLSIISSPLWGQQQSGAPMAAANAAVSSAKTVWMMPRAFVVRALEQVPDSLLSFKPVADVRSLGQLFGHIADAERLFCSLALGEPAPSPFDVTEKTKTTKAELMQALKESMAHCEKAYAQSDAAGQIPAEFFGMKGNRLFLLNLNGAHDYEHYGNIVTYMRIKGLVPPSSQR